MTTGSPKGGSPPEPDTPRERAAPPKAGVLSSTRSAYSLEAAQRCHVVELKRTLAFLEIPGDRPRLLLIDESFRA
jgi:hypothetical protein